MFSKSESYANQKKKKSHSHEEIKWANWKEASVQYTWEQGSATQLSWDTRWSWPFFYSSPRVHLPFPGDGLLFKPKKNSPPSQEICCWCNYSKPLTEGMSTTSTTGDRWESGNAAPLGAKPRLAKGTSSTQPPLSSPTPNRELQLKFVTLRTVT